MYKQLLEAHVNECVDIPRFLETIDKINKKVKSGDYIYINMMVGFGFIKYIFDRNLQPSGYKRYEDFIIEYYMNKSKMDNSEHIKWTVQQIIKIPNINLELAESSISSVGDSTNNTVDTFKLYTEIEEKTYNLTNNNDNTQPESSQLINVINFFLELHKEQTGSNIYDMTNDVMNKLNDPVPGSA